MRRRYRETRHKQLNTGHGSPAGENSLRGALIALIGSVVMSFISTPRFQAAVDDDQVCRSCGRARVEAWRGLSLTHSMSEQDPKATARCICPCGKSIDEHTPPDYLCYANYFALRDAFEPAGLNSISRWATEGFFSSTCRLCENAKDLHERSPKRNLLCPG